MQTIEIIYEDAEILAINKPPGISVHADGRTHKETIAHWILEHYPALARIGEDIITASGAILKKPGMVHRLDRDTSGILLIAKTPAAYLFLKEQFKHHAIKKTYRAILYGALAEKEGIIDLPIARSAKNFRLKSAGTRLAGKAREAITAWKCLKSAKEYSYVEAYPRTGRMHQIRAHFKAIGHPVLCDLLYAPKRVCANPPGRLALHAIALEFSHPQGAAMRLEAPLPHDFERGLEFLGLSMVQ